MPIFELLGLPLLFTVPFVPFLLAGRLFVSWYLKKDDLRWLDLALFFTFFGVGIALAIFGMIGTVSKSTGRTVLTPSALIAVAISLTITRLIISWWIKR